MFIYTYVRANFEEIDMGPYDTFEEAEEACKESARFGALTTGPHEKPDDYKLYRGSEATGIVFEIIELAAKIGAEAEIELPRDEYYAAQGFAKEEDIPEEHRDEAISMKVFKTMSQVRLLGVKGEKVKVRIQGKDYLIPFTSVRKVQLP
ncbi:hypothetical protein MYX07_04840 [Patescibacteria group bacterium AH-259-L07]|nr:hypothetical protein [Patescibacteria group bacterium AH-259-L07]